MARPVRWDRGGIVALLVCLLVAGLVGAVTPEELPSARAVGPDAAGVATAETLEVRLLDARTSAVVTEASETRYETPATFVVVTFAVQPFRDLTIVTPRLHTRDGLTYWPLQRGRIIPSHSVAVGQRITATVVFEVPPEHLPGATLTVSPFINNGVAPVVRTPTFALPDPLPAASETPVIEEPSYEAGR